ncbi:MAG TPA: biopolymer transporter ExbD [Spirochaetota bacterium]|nr:biopolymer transporter ExbD [Spirochaetota bacterium]HPI91010.1 biopolymer transporter ExbD [Spirochaetota bacterium]HPR48609.1 biopolymer transporter ExbD [Spirochaetota bacterium]
MDDTRIIYKILRRRAVRQKELEAKHFDSTSIADLAFLLLIFFIVTSSFIIRQGLFFSLPSRSSGTVRVDENRIAEVFPRENGFLYEEKIMQRGEFKSSLKKQRLKEPETILLIRMAPEIRYDRLVDAMSVARELGIERISLKNTE